MDEWIKNAAQVKPSLRQLAWQELEFYAFCHFGINTFTNREWGDGKEDPALFNPTEFNARQWVDVYKSAGMKGVILTCKHHDGFCLWPSVYTEHSVKSSPWRAGKGDIVREVVDACREGGIHFGVYLSPWDRHDQRYGTSEYNDYFKAQLRELLTEYGDVFSVWFDGACGEGPNGKRQVYDWDGYYEVIRELQPNAMISVCGPDARWCGNEAGHCRESEWSVVPVELQDREKIQEESQHVDDGEFSKQIHSGNENLGGREIIRSADKLIWYPAEVNTSIRPGWFYHDTEDDKVRSLEELKNIYFQSVGGNATFLLNIPPDQRGLIHSNDAIRLNELGQFLNFTFAHNLASEAHVEASESLRDVERILDVDKNTFWCPNEGTEQASIDIDLKDERAFDTIVLKEHVQSGQRIEKARLEYQHQGQWRYLGGFTVVGYKRILRFPQVTARYIRLTIDQSRWCPTLSAFEVYLSDKSSSSPTQ